MVLCESLLTTVGVVSCLLSGAAALHSMATFGGSSVHSSILSAGAVPALVDMVVRSPPVQKQPAKAAVATLASLAAKAEVSQAARGGALESDMPNGPTAAVTAAQQSAVYDLLVTHMQPSTPAKAADAAAALQDIAGSCRAVARVLFSNAVPCIPEVVFCTRTMAHVQHVQHQIRPHTAWKVKGKCMPAA